MRLVEGSGSPDTRKPPLVRGGQGRSDAEVSATADGCFVLVVTLGVASVALWLGYALAAVLRGLL